MFSEIVRCLSIVLIASGIILVPKMVMTLKEIDRHLEEIAANTERAL